jgi:hypothetical protein
VFWVAETESEALEVKDFAKKDKICRRSASVAMVDKLAGSLVD